MPFNAQAPASRQRSTTATIINAPMMTAPTLATKTAPAAMSFASLISGAVSGMKVIDDAFQRRVEQFEGKHQREIDESDVVLSECSPQVVMLVPE
jgi:hypothetical protein